MDRLTAVFEQFSVPEIARLLRRTALLALGVAIAAMIVAIVLDHPLAGLGVCAGLGLGLANIRFVTHSVVKMIETKASNSKRRLAGRSLSRLGVTTVIVIALMIASTQVGLGAFGGIALFYLLLIVSLIRSALQAGHRGVVA